MFPIWAVIIIAVIVVILLIAGILCLKRRKTRSLSVNTLNKLAGEDDIEKKTIFTESNQSVIVSEKVHKQPQQRLVQQQSTITNASTVIAATVPTAVVSQLSKSNIANNDTSNNSDIESSSEEPIIADSIEENKVNEYRHYDEEDAEVHMAPDPPQEIIISLPLPPPSTSFFSDKMELGDASHDENESGTANEDLYALYSKLLNKDAKRNSYLQQKAATIKSTLRKQSLRLQPHKSTAHFRSSLQNIFASNTSSDAPSDGRPLVTDTCTRKTESNANKKQPEPKVQTLSDSTKVIINMAPSAHSASAFEGQPSPINVAAAPEVIATDEATPNFLNENTRLQEDERFPTAARNSAMRVIRSASIKAKTRSMIIDKSKLSALDFVEDENDSRNKVLRQNSMTQFTTTTPTRKKGEFMTITSGSVRRLVRDSVVTQKSEPAFAFTAREKPERKSMNVMDIAGYWDNHHKKQQASLQQRSSSLDYSTAIQQQHLQQQADRNSVDDDHTVSNKAHGSHYKASLSNSVFDTLSKGKFNPAVAATHALPDEPKNDNKTSTTSGRLLARHGSLKKGATLSRNTLKFIKNSATQGVNRSLKGLFDTNTADNLSTTTTTSSFSPKPDDSQKMELTPSESESALTDIQTVAKEKVMLVKSQQQQVLDPVYHSRTNTQETDFSSNKLALGEGGDVNTPDESSKKTAIDDDEDQIDVMYASRDSSYYFGVTEEEVLDLAVADNRSSAQQLSYQNISEAMQDTADVNTTTANSTGEVEDIRRMLQETWLKNIRESGSSYSMLSEATTSAGNNNVPTSPVSPIIPTFATQQQSQLTKSLLTQQVVKRASLLAATTSQQQQQDNEEHLNLQQQQHQEGPEPSASFSSSTVRTVIPENEQQNGSNKVLEPITINRLSPYNSYTNSPTSYSQHQQQRHSHMASTFTQHYDDTVVPSPLSFSPQNSVSAASTFSRATRSSSGNNSAATAIRLGSSSSINNKTWNGRMGAGRRLIMPHNESYRQSNSYSSSRPSVLQQRFDYNDEEDTQDVGTNNEQFCEENEEEQYIHSHNRLVYTTMKRGQKTRGGIPWMSTTNLNNDMNESSSSSSQTSHQKTLAQIERDRYLESNKNYI